MGIIDCLLCSQAEGHVLKGQSARVLSPGRPPAGQRHVER